MYGRVSVWVAVTMVGEAEEGEEEETEVELGGVGDVGDAVEGVVGGGCWTGGTRSHGEKRR